MTLPLWFNPLHYFLVSRVISSPPTSLPSIPYRSLYASRLIGYFVACLFPSHCSRLQAFPLSAWWFFSGTHRMRVQPPSEFYAEIIGNYLSLADDILFHLYIVTLRVKHRSPMIESRSLERHDSVGTCTNGDGKRSNSRKAVLGRKKNKMVNVWKIPDLRFIQGKDYLALQQK